MSDVVYKFYLKKNNSTYYYLENGGVVEGPKTPLKYAVADWIDVELSIKRNMINWGCFREFSIPMKFVLDGAKVLRHVYSIDEFTADCIFEIEKLNTTTRQYIPWYSGEIDFSMKSDERDFFEVNILSRGLTELLKNLEDTPYEIPLDDPDAVEITLDGVYLQNRIQYVIGNYSVASGVEPPTDLYIHSGPYSVIAFSTNEEWATFPIYRPHDQEIMLGGNFIALRDQGLYIGLARDIMKNISITGNFELIVKPPTSTVYNIEIWLTAGHIDFPTDADEILLATTATNGATGAQKIQVPINKLIPVIDPSLPIPYEPVPKFFFLRIKCTNAPLLGVPFYYNMDNSFLNMEFLSKTPTSTTKGFRQIDLFKKLVAKITDGMYGAESEYLSNTNASDAQRFLNWDHSPYNTIVTCGDSLRNIVTIVDGEPQPNKIKTTFFDFYKSMWCKDMLSLTIENDIVKLEPLKAVLSDDVIFSVDTVTNVRTYPYREEIYNQVKVGYSSYDNDNVVGRNEFNTGTTFLLEKANRVKNENELINPYRADVYGIESIRSQTFNSDRKDNKFDNDVFLIEIDPQIREDGTYEPYRPEWATITGVDDTEGVYNITMSPMRAFLRHLPRIRSFIKKGYARFQSTDKNQNLKTLFSSSQPSSWIIDESEDVLLEGSGTDLYKGRNVAPLFKNEVIEFECAPPYNLGEILALKSKGCVSFKSNGMVFKGFILDASVTPATRDKRTFQLLSHRDNDLSKLIP